MRARISRQLPQTLGVTCIFLLAGHLAASAAPAGDRATSGSSARGTAFTAASDIDDSTWTDHDGVPIPPPPDWQENFWGHGLRQALVDPLSHAFDIPNKLFAVAKLFGAHPDRQAVNVNAFDEVPNSSWFTNRNHVRAVPTSELAQGPDAVTLPRMPWVIRHAKHGGTSLGFQIKDADGKKWLVKIDPRGYPQLSGGADMISRTLLHAAGYNVPHNEPVRFVRSDLTIDPELQKGTKGERFTDANLDSLLARCAVVPDGRFTGFASQYLAGHVLGSPSMNRKRPGDANDWYTHANRRDLRGLYVVCSWIGDWDTKDANFLDTFTQTRDSLGHVDHYILDPGSSLGANATGPKLLSGAFENDFDFKWVVRRFVTLGFIIEPWRRAHQNSGIPSVGNFESVEFQPNTFRPELQQPAFIHMTDRDAYWGAKIVASFSDAQIAAAVDAAHYDDPRAPTFLVQRLIERRDKIARYWFGRVAPLDFFVVHGAALRFHDLAVDVGLTHARGYDVEVEGGHGAGQSETHSRLHVDSATLPLADLAHAASTLSLEISVTGSRAKPTHVELTRRGSEWVVMRVIHA